VYVYESLPQWGPPVGYFLIQDSGYPNYAGVLAIRPRDKAELTPCLRKLVPIFQQAQVDLWTDPSAAAGRLVKTVAGFRTFFTYGADNARFGFCQLQREGLVSNPRQGPLGMLESSKIDKLLTLLVPIFTGQKAVPIPGLPRTDVPPGLTAGALATNEFLDPGVRLPGSPPGYYSTCAARAAR
jgi:hypothetical protein